MVYLKEGVLLKLVEEMKRKRGDDPIISKPVLLQIRSIIPVLEEGDLWPSRGFFLKVSDLSHALYVSLSKHQNDMILANKLQLGQFIYVNKLDPSDPLPLLRGLAPIPGRRPFQGTPQDLAAPPPPFVGRRRPSDPQSSRRKSDGGLRPGRSRSSSPTKPQIDADCAVLPMRVPKRRSWSESEILGVTEIFDSSAAKHEIKLPSRCASASASPARYESSDDGSISVSRGRGGGGNLGKRGNASLHSMCNVICDRKGAETRISWTSLPPNLVNHGKEVMRQRDAALQAAADALQGACVYERLLNSLSTMSQFPLAEVDDLQPFVDKFLNVEHDLAQTRLIMQSLSPSTNQESEYALERRRNANAWIKCAIALDLSPCLSPLITPPDPTKAGRARGGGSCIIRRNKSADLTLADDVALGLVSHEKEDEEAEWGRAAEVAAALQDECKKVLLMYVDRYLEQVERKSEVAGCGDQQMAGMMYKVKMVSDWLNSSVKREGDGDGEGDGEADQAEAYVRARDKIYAILLKNVERTAAVAFP